MTRSKPTPKGKKVTCICHGYPANRETAHVPVIWEDVWIEFAGNHRRDKRRLGPCIIGMDDADVTNPAHDGLMAEYKAAIEAADPVTGKTKVYGRVRDVEDLLETMRREEEDAVEAAARFERLKAGEIVFDPNDEHTPNIPIIYMPVARLTRKDLEDALVFYMKRLGFHTPPRFKWRRTNFVVWSC